jgi:serine/threonine-protein kinase
VQQVGRYQILGELGRGAMGVVYKALDPAIGRTIAIKSIRLTDLTDEAERQRLRDRLFREARSAGILSHPNIVTIYDIAEEGDRAYIFMEFVSGPPLEKLMASPQTLQPDVLLSIFRQTAAALDYAHKKGIVHRDIKPTNIMIQDDGTAKVTDFGVAKILSQNLSATGGMMGTPSYMPPEQIQGEISVDGRADQFSLAVVVYEALTGEKPFAAEHLPTLLFKIVRDDFLPPQRLNPTLGPRLETVLRRAMAKKAADRYGSCGEFIGALSAACRTSPGWTPLPRGASQNMPTLGAVQTPAVEKPAAAAATMPTNWPAPRDPRARHEPSHTLRNGILMTAALASVCAGAFFVLRTPVSTANNQVVQSSPQPEAPPPSNPLPPQQNVPEPPPPTPSVTQVAPAPTPRPAPPAIKRATPPPLPADGVFELTGTPSGSVAVFDNDPELRCTIPCSITLSRGRHTFLVSGNGYREARRIIEIPQDSSLAVDLERSSGMLSVTSTPPGLAVVIDGHVQLRRTPAIFPVSPGRHRVEVARGTEKRESDVEIHDGATYSLSVDWPR